MRNLILVPGLIVTFFFTLSLSSYAYAEKGKSDDSSMGKMKDCPMQKMDNSSNSKDCSCTGMHMKNQNMGDDKTMMGRDMDGCMGSMQNSIKGDMSNCPMCAGGMNDTSQQMKDHQFMNGLYSTLKKHHLNWHIHALSGMKHHDNSWHRSAKDKCDMTGHHKTRSFDDIKRSKPKHFKSKGCCR
jgi:hypothetical protein